MIVLGYPPRGDPAPPHHRLHIQSAVLAPCCCEWFAPQANQTMNHIRLSLTALALMAGTWPLAAQTVTPPKPEETAASSEEEKTIELSPFEIRSTRDTGYAATETLAGTRIRTDLKDVASSISV